MIYLSTLLLSLFITISLTPVFIKIAGKIKALDMPDKRKVHTAPIPRIGGAAMAIGVFVTMMLWGEVGQFLKAYVIGAIIIVFFGVIDDSRGLTYKIKFAGQIAAALVIVCYGGLRIVNLGLLLPDGATVPSWIGVPLTVVLVVGVTNAINLSDGLDGLAGGLSLLGFCCIGYLAYLEGNLIIALISIALIGAIFGFLRFNTYPASLFMGDTGSQFLGFSLVVTSVSLTQGATALSPVLPLIIFGFPVLDTITVMVSRLLEGRSPFMPDKKHFHHRLIGVGFYHTEAVLIIYVIQAALVTSAFVFRFYSEWVLLIGYVVFALLFVGAFIEASRRNFTVKRFSIIDDVVKGRLKVLKERGIFIIVIFKIIEFGVPLLLFITCFIPRTIPVFVSFVSAFLIAFVVIVWVLKKSRLRPVLTITLYLLIPFIVYLSTTDARWSAGSHEYVDFIYNSLFVFVAFFVVLTLKFTRRKRGFKVTPMDFLIFFIALVAPYVAGTYTKYSEIGAMAAKTIVMFFSFEVLMGELRGRFDKLTFATVCVLLALTARGFLEA